MDDDNYPTVQNPDGSESEHVGASTSVAAAGLASARENRTENNKMSNNSIGNAMLNARSYGTALKTYQQNTKAP